MRFKNQWKKVNILQTQENEIQQLIQKYNKFPNVSQFVVYAVRKEIDVHNSGSRTKK